MKEYLQDLSREKEYDMFLSIGFLVFENKKSDSF